MKIIAAYSLASAYVRLQVSPCFLKYHCLSFYTMTPKSMMYIIGSVRDTVIIMEK
jgi:hypothetical protein